VVWCCRSWECQTSLARSCHFACQISPILYRFVCSPPSNSILLWAAKSFCQPGGLVNISQWDVEFGIFKLWGNNWNVMTRMLTVVISSKLVYRWWISQSSVDYSNSFSPVPSPVGRVSVVHIRESIMWIWGSTLWSVILLLKISQFFTKFGWRASSNLYIL